MQIGKGVCYHLLYYENTKTEFKKRAIILRKQGLTYGEILKQVPVAKSTLSLWLRSVNLSKRQMQKITNKKMASAKRGGIRKREIKLQKIKDIKKCAEKDIKLLKKENLWLIGIILYWTEGTKEKEHNISQIVELGNSDPKMIKLFIKWLNETIKVSKENMIFELYIHKKSDRKSSLEWWARTLNCNEEKIRVYFKKHRPKGTKRKNVGKNYHRLLRVKVKRSSDLNRKIAAWIEIICNYWGVD